MKFIKPFGPIIGEAELTPEQNDLLVQACQNSMNDESKRANKLLVGYIKKEFIITDQIKTTLLPVFYEKVLEYLNAIEGPYQTLKPFKKHDIICEGAWCNIQEPYEFNPLHNHCLSDIVCVTFPKVNLDSNYNVYESNSKRLPGALHLTCTTNDAKFATHLYEIIPNTGKMYIFPGTLMHYTSPFFKEGDVRWSTSTNFMFSENFYHIRGIRNNEYRAI